MRRFIVVALTAALVVGAALPAAADPKAETFELACVGVPSGTITANGGNGLWTPGFASATTGVYIPYGFEFNATFIPDDGGEPVVLPSDVFMKKAPKNTKSHRHGVCTFGGEERVVDDPDFGTGVFQFSATVFVFWTGK